LRLKDTAIKAQFYSKTEPGLTFIKPSSLLDKGASGRRVLGEPQNFQDGKNKSRVKVSNPSFRNSKSQHPTGNQVSLASTSSGATLEF